MNDYLNLIDSNPVTTTAEQARRNLYTAAGANPVQAGQYKQIGDTLGLTPQAVDLDPKGFEDLAKSKKADQLLAAHPEVEDYFSKDLTNAQVSKDDVEGLSNVAKVSRLTSWLASGDYLPSPSAWGKELTAAYYETNLNRKVAGGVLTGTLDKDWLQQQEEVLSKMRDKDGLSPLAQATMGLIGGMLSNAQAAVTVGTGAAAIGAAVGGVGAGPAFALGTGYGFAADMATTTAGQVYRNLAQFRDENGNELSESVKLMAMSAGALVGGLFGGVGAHYTSAQVSGAINYAMRKMLVEPTTRGALTRAGAQLSQSGLTFGAINLGLFMGTEIAQEAAKAIGTGGNASTIFNDVDKLAQFTQAGTTSFLHGLALGGVLGVVPTGMNYFADRARIQQYGLMQQRVDKIYEAIQQAQTTKLDPERMASFVDDHLKLQPVMVGVDAVKELQSKGGLGFIAEEAIQNASAHGGEVPIKAGDYFTKVTPEEHETLRPFIRNESGLTQIDVEHLQLKNPEDYLDAFHFSNVLFNRFDHKFWLTGEGAMSEGAGHYVAEERAVAGTYQNYYQKSEFTVDGAPYDWHNPMHNFLMSVDRNGLAPTLVEYLSENDYYKQVIASGEASSYTHKSFAENEELLKKIFEITKTKEITDITPEHLKLFPKFKKETLGGIYNVKIKRPLEHFTHLESDLSANSQYVKDALKKAGFEWTEPTKDAPGKIFWKGKELEVPYHNDKGQGYDLYKAWTKMRGFELLKDEKALEQWAMDRGDQSYVPGEGVDIGWAASNRANIEFTEMMLENGIAGHRYMDSGSFASWDRAKERVARYKDRLELSENVLEVLKRTKPDDTKSIEVYMNHIKSDKASLEKAYEILEEAEQKITHNYSVFHDSDLEPTHLNGVPISDLIKESPEAKAVANEVFEAEQEIKKVLFLDPVFEKVNAAGMTKPMFEKFSKLIQEQQKNLTMAALKAAEKEIARRETKLWKANLAVELENAKEAQNNQPAWKAHDLLTDEAFGKLDREAVNELFEEGDAWHKVLGGQAADALPKEYFESGGFHPDQYADQLGFSSGKEMIEALLDIQLERQGLGISVKQLREMEAQHMAEQAMEDKYGRLEDRIMEEAMEAAISVQQLKIMVDELNLKAGDNPLKLEDVISHIKETHANMPVKQALDWQNFLRQVQKYGNEALSKTQVGKHDEAFMAKQKQMINLGLMDEARRAQKQYAADQKLISKFTDNAIVKGIDPEHFNWGQFLLWKHDNDSVKGGLDYLRQKLKLENGEDLGHEFLEWVKKEADNYNDILLTPTSAAITAPTSLSAMRWAEHRDFMATLKSIDHQGRAKQFLENDAKKTELKLALESLQQSFDSLPQRGLDRDSIIWALDANNLKMEQMLNWIEDNNPHGVINQYVTYPLMEAIYRREDLNRQLMNKIMEARDFAPPSKKIDRLAKNDLLIDPLTGKPMKLTHGNLLMIMLNMGNAGNKAKLLAGYGWDEGNVLAVLHQNTNAKDMKFVQHIWDAVGTLWPHLSETTEKSFGVPPPKVQGVSFSLHGQTIEGGYFPLIKDGIRSKVEVTDGPLERNGFHPIASSAAAMFERTNVAYPLELDFNQLAGKLRETTNAIALHIPVREAWKVLNTDTVKQGLIKTMGEDYWKQITPWMQRVANDGGLTNTADTSKLSRAAALTRENLVTYLVGYRLGTALIHGGSAASNSVGEVGIGPFSKASMEIIKDYMSGKTDLVDWIYENSGEIRHRKQFIDRDLTAALNRAVNEGDPIKRWSQHYSHMMIYGFDQFTTYPTWLAAFRNAKEKGEMDATARNMADQAVRNAHGTSSIFGQAAIQQWGGEAGKFLTMFYGYFNHNYNRLRDIGVDMERGLKAGDFGRAMNASIRLMYYIAFPAFIHNLVRGHKDPNADPAEKESLAKTLGMAIGDQVFSSHFLTRDAWQAGAHGFASGGTPLTEIFQLGKNVKSDLKKWSEGEDDPKFIEDAMNVLAIGKGYGSKSVSTWTQTLFDNAVGNERSMTPHDKWKMLVEGQRKPARDE